MKCIYCNEENDLTVSDIIPAALTGAKIRKKFVCHKHNQFTNKNYERYMNSKLAIFRNLVGLRERDGDPVRFVADLTIGGYTFPNTSISDKGSIVGTTNRKFSKKYENGKKVVIGEKQELLKIKGVSEDEIETICMEDVFIDVRSDMRELFVSNQVLHVIAKIAYEWHCWVNDIEEFNESKYGEIVSYILNPECDSKIVELVLDPYVWTLMDRFSRTGTNMIFEYNDCDGNVYVVFGFWGIILYKVRICKNDNYELSETNVYNAYLYHVDGTSEGTMFGVIGKPHFISEEPNVGLEVLCAGIKARLSKLGERDLTKDYISNNINIVKQLLPKYKIGRCTLAKLLDYEHDDRVIPIHILEILYKNRKEYDKSESFTKNMQRILGCEERLAITEEEKKEMLKKYMCMDENGTFAVMLEKAIDFFECICLEGNK